MTQSDNIRRGLYSNRPYNEQDRVNMTRWNNKEKYFDELNRQEIERMDLSHLNKTKTKQIQTAMRAWDKEHKRQAKFLADEKKNPNSVYAIERTWIIL